MNIESCRALLARAIESHGSMRATAKAWEISDTYLRDVVHKRKEPGPAILEQLGLERVVTYRRKNGG